MTNKKTKIYLEVKNTHNILLKTKKNFNSKNFKKPKQYKKYLLFLKTEIEKNPKNQYYAFYITPFNDFFYKNKCINSINTHKIIYDKKYFYDIKRRLEQHYKNINKIDISQLIINSHFINQDQIMNFFKIINRLENELKELNLLKK